MLELTLHDNIIRRADVRRIYNFYSFTDISRSVYFDFVCSNWDAILIKLVTLFFFV